MEGKNITKQINQQYKKVFNLRIEMNKSPKYSSQWFEVRDKYIEAFKELETLENKKLKGGFKMSEVLNQNSGTLKKSAGARTTTKQRKTRTKGKTIATNKVTKKKSENGAKRLEKKAQLIKTIATDHGTEIKRVWKKDQKRQSVVKAMQKHGLTESQVYQTMNYLNLIKTAGAQKKLAKLKEAGLL